MRRGGQTYDTRVDGKWHIILEKVGKGILIFLEAHKNNSSITILMELYDHVLGVILSFESKPSYQTLIETKQDLCMKLAV